MAPDRAMALAEVRRILRPGGRAMVTGAERHGRSEAPASGKAAPGKAAPGEAAPGDGATGEAFRWAPLAAAAGLDVVSRYAS
jgi:hypothetical protein